METVQLWNLNQDGVGRSHFLAKVGVSRCDNPVRVQRTEGIACRQALRRCTRRPLLQRDEDHR